MIKANELRPDNKAVLDEKTPKPSAFRKVSQNILGGSFLAKEGVVSLLPFLLFATLLALCYIANVYYAEKDIREFNATTRELKELRYEYISTKSTLMNIGKQSEISRRLQGSGIKESVVPPYKLFVEKTEDKQ